MPTNAPTVGPATVQWTLDAYLKTPRIISRDLTSITAKRFIADRIFSHGTPDQVQGGAAVYQKSENIYLDAGRDFEEVGVRAAFPRAGWSEDLFTAAVHQYGLEVPISYLSIRRNARDIATRARIKIANNLVRSFDGKLFTLLAAEVSAGNVQTTTATASWSGGSQKILADFAKARRLIAAADEGYELDTVLLSLQDEASMLTDSSILGALGREGTNNPAERGEVSRLFGISQIIGTPRLAQGTAWFLQSGISGTIADEPPAPEEGYTSDANANADLAQMWVRVYDDVTRSQRVIRAMRSAAMWVSEPKAVVQMTGL